MKRIHKVSIVSLIAIIIVAGATTWYIFGLFEYSLRATIKDDGTIIIQPLSLGEYYTPVTSLEINESETGNNLVSFVAKSENSRMHTVTLRKGAKQVNDLYLDGYTIEFPGETTYTFQPGTKYIVEVEWDGYKKEVSFVLPNGT